MIVAACLGLTGLVVAGLVLLRKWSGLSNGPRAITEPSQCQTALATTTSCRGEDDGFQECHYFFRADGAPRPEVCRAFQAAVSEAPETARDAGPPSCDEASPVGWHRIECARLGLHAASACFECATTELEASRTSIQAFDATCVAATVTKACNVPLAEATAKLSRESHSDVD